MVFDNVGMDAIIKKASTRHKRNLGGKSSFSKKKQALIRDISPVVLLE
jgi:hypothetical protein